MNKNNSENSQGLPLYGTASFHLIEYFLCILTAWARLDLQLHLYALSPPIPLFYRWPLFQVFVFR